MMDVIPMMVDGAVVMNLDNSCTVKSNSCENCSRLVIHIHNWIKKIKLEYLVFDLQEEKDICPTFIIEVMQIKKRLEYPFLFCGVMQQARFSLASYNCNRTYPFFVTPEDAIRALRIQNPGLTEITISNNIHFGRSLIDFIKGDAQHQVSQEKEVEAPKLSQLTI